MTATSCAESRNRWSNISSFAKHTVAKLESKIQRNRWGAGQEFHNPPMSAGLSNGTVDKIMSKRALRDQPALSEFLSSVFRKVQLPGHILQYNRLLWLCFDHVIGNYQTLFSKCKVAEVQTDVSGIASNTFSLDKARLCQRQVWDLVPKSSMSFGHIFVTLSLSNSELPTPHLCAPEWTALPWRDNLK